MASACTATPVAVAGPSSKNVAAMFAAAWQGLQPSKIAALTTDSGSAAQAVVSVITHLAPAKLVVLPSPVAEADGGTATATAVFDWSLPGGISWKYTAHWSFIRAAGNGPWQAQWAPTLINPQLAAAQTVSLRTNPASNGSIVDRNDQQILAPVTIHSVVALPSKIANLERTAADLAAVLSKLDPTVTAASVVAGVRAATGTVGYTVTNLRDADFISVSGQLAIISGLTFPSATRNLPPTKDFAKQLLSEVNPVAATLAAGVPGWEIDSVDTTGAVVDILASQPVIPGKNVTLTIDTAIQKSAEAALTLANKPAVLVAIAPSTGEILAVAQNAAANALGPIALRGEYPPGSTFKIVTATAGFDGGVVAPDTQVDCPGEVVFDSRSIHNSESFALGTISLTYAFARSCNTTFAKLATLLPSDALPIASLKYGIGADFVIPGITTLTGKTQSATTMIQKAANGFGQGTDLVTPFSEALMAATVANGAMPMPTVIRGTRTTVDLPAAARSPLSVEGVRALMRAVVTQGTARALQDAGTVFAKTGTADALDAVGNPVADAWTSGYRGDVAFSVLVVDGQSSGLTAQMARVFLKGFPAS